MHHMDGSHRWAGGPAAVPLEAWQAGIRAHMEEHVRTMGGPAADRPPSIHVQARRRGVLEVPARVLADAQVALWDAGPRPGKPTVRGRSGAQSYGPRSQTPADR